MSHPPLRRISTALASLMLVSFTSGVANVQAGEVYIANSNFDELAPSPAWYWENWSRAGSTVTYDATLNAAGGAAGSGSLRLSAPFDPANTGWQEAVFTLDVADFDASQLQSLSFDVKVDPSSVTRAEGDYGSIQVILRNGSNWDWKQESFTSLTSTSWERVTVHLDIGEHPIDAITAITIRIAANGMKGVVTANVDNIAFNEEVIIDNFDRGDIGGWTATWGGAPELTYDTADRYGRETSGSLRVAANYFDPNVTTWQQVVLTVPFTETNVTMGFTHVNLDVRVDPASVLSRDNNYGYFEVKRVTGNGARIGAGVNLTGNEWTHLSFEISPQEGLLSSLLFQLGSGSFTGPVIYNLDNLSWSRRFAPPPPPTLSIAPAPSGLNLIHTDPFQYGRHNIYSADSSQLGFYNQDGPISYSFTLAGFPSSASAPSFQAHMFLVPGSPSTRADPDWHEPTLLFLDVKATAGGANAVLRWKQNQGEGNSQLYAGGLPNVNSATVLGTWTVTASDNTHFVVTAPDGATTSLDLAPEVAALFDGPIRFYVGVQGNDPNNSGQHALFSGVKIAKGANVLLEDDFTGDVLDETKWVINAFAGGVQFIAPTEAGYFLTWTTPDNGLSLQWASTLDKNAIWTDLATTPYEVGSLKKGATLRKSELPDSPTVFWRMAGTP